MKSRSLQKLTKTEMENLRRQRLRDEFQKTRAIIDARRPNLNCKMEHGDILEQMRELFLATEKQLRTVEAQLAQLHQNFAAAYGQSFMQGFNQGKNFAQLESFIKHFATVNRSPEQILAFLQSIQSAQPVQRNGSESEMDSTFNNSQTVNDSGLSLSPDKSL